MTTETLWERATTLAAPSGTVGAVVRLKARVSEILREATSGMDSWGQVSDRFRTLDGYIRWGAIERAIHGAIDEANNSPTVSSDAKREANTSGGIGSTNIPCEAGKVSDGYHTFDELYEHRCTLFVALMAAHPMLGWISPAHDDGTMFPGWFICGMNLPTGTVSYHLPVSMLGLAQDTGAAVLPRAPKWDGHTAADVVTRIQAWLRSNAEHHARPERT